MANENFDLTTDQFGLFWKYLENPDVTDIDLNGNTVWITDLKHGCYAVEEDVSQKFLTQFTHDVSNAINKPFNDVQNVLEADTRDLRITIIHDKAATSGTDISIRRSPAVVRNTIDSMVEDNYCPEEILHLLINCVIAKMNFVFGGEPGCGKTECAKFFEQFIQGNQKVITIEDVLEMHYKDIYPERNCTELKISKTFTYQDSIKVCLRKNPKWLMLSEARSKEVKFLIQQWSTGVHGFSTIHMEDIRFLADRILSMMEHVGDTQLMTNRIYRAVDIGILIRCEKREDGSLKRYIDQVGFYTRENGENKVYMVMDDGQIVSHEIPKSILRKMKHANIKNPFVCDTMDKFRKAERLRNGKNEKEESKE